MSENEKIMSIITTSIIEYAEINGGFLGHALQNINIKQPTDEELKQAVNNYYSEDSETTLRIQEIDEDGEIIDEYDLPAPDQQLDYEDYNCKKTIIEQLLNLARQERLMKAVGDHNYRKTYKSAVELLARNHTGYQIENDSVSIPGPLASFISEERQDELWKMFLADQGLDSDLDEDLREVNTGE